MTLAAVDHEKALAELDQLVAETYQLWDEEWVGFSWRNYTYDHMSREELDVKLWSRVNSGLCLLYKPALDFDFCDRALATTSEQRRKPPGKSHKDLPVKCLGQSYSDMASASGLRPP